MQGYVYKITIGDNCYYGQTINLESREYTHRNALENGRHHNQWMQRAFEKYGELQFKLVATVTDAEHLDELEQFYLDCHWGNPNCMNLAKDAKSPRRGLKHSEETKAKLRASQLGVVRKHKFKPCYAKPVDSEEWIEFPSGKAAAQYTGCKPPNISACIKGKLQSTKGWQFRR